MARLFKAQGSRSVQYRIYSFIEAVKAHPLLWDRGQEGFHNRDTRQEIWLDIARQLELVTDSSTPAEKHKYVKALAKRWKNTRDSFFRIQRLKKTSQEPLSYIYEKELRFLIKEQQEPHETPAAESATSSLMHSNTSRTSMTTRSKRRHGITKVRKQAQKRKARETTAPVQALLSKKRASSIATLSDDEDLDLVDADPDASVAADTAQTETKADEVEVEVEAAIAAEQASMNTLRLCESQELEMNPIATPMVTVYQGMSAARNEVFRASMGGNEDTSIEFKAAAHSAQTQTNANTALATTAATVIAPAPCTAPAAIDDVDTDQAFFDSIKPYLRRMGLDEKLNFQLQTLQLLKSYRTH